MKIFSFLCLLLLMAFAATAQISIPDNALKNRLLNHNPVIDTNGDDDIQISEAQSFTGTLNLSGFNSTGYIANATGIEEFINATGLDISGNTLSSIDLSTLGNLEELNLRINNLSSIDVSALTNLKVLNINGNNLSSIDLSAISALEELQVKANNLSSTDLSSLVNLKELDLSGNTLTSVDLSSLANLKWLRIGGNNLTSIDLSSLVNLEIAELSGNPLSVVDFSDNLLLTYAQLMETDVTNLDFSNNPVLEKVNFCNSSNLEYVNLKNGNTIGIAIEEGFLGNFNMETVCVDAIGDMEDYDYQDLVTNNPNAVVTTYCSFSPTLSNTISGKFRYDTGLGCSDPSAMQLPNRIVKAENSGENYATATNNNGVYNLFVETGTNITSIESTFPSYFTISPASQSSTFTGYGNTDTVDFCLEATTTIEDLNVTIIPVSQVKPGFEGRYRIIYENIGTETVNYGQVTFDYDYNLMDIEYTNPTWNSSTGGALAFDFTNLIPFESREIYVKVEYKQPPILNAGDVLNFSTQITPDTNDNTPGDNSYTLTQTAVNSYDPNDKQVLEGNQILLEETDEYLHYLIRFQNMGTANATNVVVTDTLSNQLAWSSLQMLSASDDYQMRITDNNFVEFIFEGIDLPYEAADEEGSKGYVAYKIKPKPEIAIGDIMEGDAAIYFDFNPPIITNWVSTEVVKTLSVEKEKFDNSFQLYPNPTTGLITISTNDTFSLSTIAVYDIGGKKVIEQPANISVNLSTLSPGVYFVKLTEKNGKSVTKKLIKK